MSEDEFTAGQLAIIEGMINKALTKFRLSTLLGEQGICIMQHKNMCFKVKEAVRDELTIWKDDITKKVIYGAVSIVISTVIVQVALHMMSK